MNKVSQLSMITNSFFDFLVQPLKFITVIYEILTCKKIKSIVIGNNIHQADILLHFSHFIYFGFLLISILFSMLVTNIFRFLYHWKSLSIAEALEFRWEAFLILFITNHLFDRLIFRVFKCDIIPT